ncbi:MAG: dinitrogenase iron-molybdenum cofactor biosynthesis protein [Candidatus Abyssobacteria bacterium SURF_17]|uniref:Dinitrogenase iron-molybdenum cofactor biosynthesis protein n=1 Tax=Candidatus Abyssobacteria bacterium SURF_17 TaxID=2093361 RepID=A0A419EPH0_9BACT|nr:MAG: dinitrogenase iron-molybdenum cofactor biosynthesis protein [Candidatus Abyssubacteria bacterium SURF_17]
MKIAITAQGDQMDSPVDPRFGRAKWFAVIDTETGSHRFVDNAQNFAAAQGAGIQAGSNVAKLGVGAVVTGNVGPKAFATLHAAGIKVYLGANGTVQDALNQYTAGTLTLAQDANVAGHWV